MKARGYVLDRKILIDRRKHRVYLNNRTTAAELIKELEEMPDCATFEEFEFYSDDEHYIEFHSDEVVGSGDNP